MGQVADGATQQLRERVIAASESDVWDEAVQEWDIAGAVDNGEPTETCACGQVGLRYLFTIKNRVTGETIFPIGSTCIRKFGVDALDDDIDAWQQAFALMAAAEKLGRGREVGLWDGAFSRKLIGFLAEQGAFDNDPDPRWEVKSFLMRMFNARYRSGAQVMRVKAIIHNDVYPWLRNLYRRTRLETRA